MFPGDVSGTLSANNFCARVKTEPVAISEQNIKENKELAKLQLFGAGPKMRGLGIFPTDGLSRHLSRGYLIKSNL